MTGTEVLDFLLGFLIGCLFYRQLVINKAKKLFEQVIQESDNHDSEIYCVLEQHHDQYFLYQHPNMQFVAQANSMDELNNIILEKFPKSTTIKILMEPHENSISK